MKDRIEENEKRLNNIKKIINEVNNSLDDFDKLDTDIKLLDKYYGSKEWFDDLKKYDKGEFPKVKAGVLSEDEVWDTLENLNELIDRMNFFVSKYER